MVFKLNPYTGNLDFIGVDPSVVATQYDADVGSAVPAGGVLNIVGNAAQGVSTSAAGNTVTITVADATAGATALLASKGVASFDSAYFTVTNGFVKLTGGVVAEDFITDDGAPAVEPSAIGTINILGGDNIYVSGQGPGNTVTVQVDGTTDNAVQIGNAVGSLTSLAGGLTASVDIYWDTTAKAAKVVQAP
jgi:hypothetical protein